ncbi:xyloside xylosyltransferase 1 [Aplysia californica]|uniref:Xyloside xylosyltransferase 1 n=1 Tax=Aplysia californica TaxID=6500 RepID=A0ABM0JG09_APLCA|nr:xyloside xylosyltransferase 1 [Aplysia californica]
MRKCMKIQYVSLILGTIGLLALCMKLLAKQTDPFLSIKYHYQYDEDNPERRVQHWPHHNYSSVASHKDENVFHFHVMFIYSLVSKKAYVKESFDACVSTLLNHSSLPLAIHIVGDIESFGLASKTLKAASFYGPVIHHDTESFPEDVQTVISSVRGAVYQKKKSKFSDTIFFLSMVMHRFLPSSVSKLILFDVDIVFQSDVKDLFSLFDDFNEKNVMGLARENQPVYRNVFWEYRKKNPGTRIGEPPPTGLTGFNSGVVLLDLDKMRRSKVYNVYLDEVRMLSSLVQKYEFQGNLGDQDLFTLISIENEELFYVLPCRWNRQLCTWWRRDEYVEIFDLYYACEGPIHLLHGNCKTDIGLPLKGTRKEN